MTRLGKLHADTAGKAADYGALLHAANPAWVDTPVQDAPPLGIPHFTEILTQFGSLVESALLAELQVYERVEQPAVFRFAAP
ncbi:MAG: hypothetical protein R3E79_59345 [Caldilineaceae bacterium]